MRNCLHHVGELECSLLWLSIDSIYTAAAVQEKNSLSLLWCQTLLRTYSSIGALTQNNTSIDSLLSLYASESIPRVFVCVFTPHAFRPRSVLPAACVKRDGAYMCVAAGRSGAELKPYITSFKASCSRPAVQTRQSAARERERGENSFTERRIKEKRLWRGERA